MSNTLDQSQSHTDKQIQNEHQHTIGELERYKMLVENVEDYAIFLLDPDGYVQTWNKGAEKNKGYTADEIIGKHFSNFYTERDKADGKPERELEIAKKVGRVEDEDWRVKKDGSKFWANVVITALRDEKGTLQGFAKVTRNLTERKKNEDDLRSANLLLKQQQRELKLLNESKDDFISLASHQLRTPATAIKQLLGLIIEGYEGNISDSVMQLLKKTYESNERQITIVNSLLKVAQIDSGKVVLRKEPTDLNKTIHSLVKQYTGIITNKNQEVVLNLCKSPLYGYVDEQYYRMALENILDNASKYTGENGKITISSKEDGDYAIVSIADSGVGINPKLINSLFQKFNRIPNDLSHKVAGSGLGLYWADKVINLHQGGITVESEHNKGTIFTVAVPKGVLNA